MQRMLAYYDTEIIDDFNKPSKYEMITYFLNVEQFIIN